MPVFAITGTAYFCDGFAFDDIEARDEAHARERVEELVHERADRNHCLMLNEVCIDCVTQHPDPAPARSGPRHPAPWRIVKGATLSESSALHIVDANGDLVVAIAGHGVPGEDAHYDDWAVAHTIVGSVNLTEEDAL